MKEIDKVIHPMTRHSQEQLFFIEKCCREQLNDVSVDLRTANMFLVQLAQHGSDVFPRLADGILKKGQDTRLENFVLSQSALHAHVRDLLHATRELFDDEAKIKICDQKTPYFYEAPNPNNTMVVIFTTSYNNFHISNLALAATLAREEFSFLLVKDPSGMQYTRGISGISDSWAAAMIWLKKFIQMHKGKHRIVFAGFSSSGFSAILAALYSGPDYTVSFGPKSTMKKEGKFLPTKVMTSLMFDKMPLHLKCDLVQQFGLYSQKIRVIVGANSNIDVHHAHRLSASPTVSVSEINKCGHICIPPLLLGGAFTKLFTR